MSKSTIKFLSGWTNPGGSTTAFINLTNLLNENGYDAIFCGPHKYHLGKCKSNYLSNLRIKEDDIIVCHFLPNIVTRPNCKKFVLSLHEKELFPLKQNTYEIYDKIHFLNEEQRKWHGVEEYPHFICGNAHEELRIASETPKKVAGIVGSIDRNKNTHESINRAISDGIEDILIFGEVTDPHYFNAEVKPLFERNEKIKIMGYVEDKQKIYDSVSDVYLSSNSENASLVQDECVLTNTKFHGNENILPSNIMSNIEVISKWVEEMEI